MPELHDIGDDISERGEDERENLVCVKPDGIVRQSRKKYCSVGGEGRESVCGEGGGHGLDEPRIRRREYEAFRIKLEEPARVMKARQQGAARNTMASAPASLCAKVNVESETRPSEGLAP